ncbi:MAG TPA: isoprenylcysteine carboxylmethyltransferase family protein [Kofleriaceae bacterium]|jgi:protein-S-isoprenylcysteine O-methyltransferase Ste14
MIGAYVAIAGAWIALEAAWTVPEVPEPRTLALPTGLVLFATQAATLAVHARGSAIGAVILVGGIALRLWAIRTLGDAFATAIAPRRIVRTGPYRWLRHPSELGLVLAAAGGAVWLGSALGLAVAALLVPLSIVRARRENAAIA